MTSLTAIVPATNRPPTLDRALAAIRAAGEGPDEVVVVTDPANTGPAAARNRGAEGARGEILVFVDSDVIVAPDAFARIRQAFTADPELTAIFGSYDDGSAAGGPVTAFRNLLQAEVHDSAPGTAETFWAGLGAVRRDAFERAGGFDAARYPAPAIEDIELGMRLIDAGGRIRLDPKIRGTHLKRWTLRSMVRSDLLARGAPWVELLAERRVAPSVMNLGWRHRVSAAASLLLVGSLVRPRVAIAPLVVLVFLNRSLYARLWRLGGLRLALPAPGLHAIHHLTSVAAVPIGLAAHLRRR